MKITSLPSSLTVAFWLLPGVLWFHAYGAAGDIDLSFDAGSGLNGGVTAMAVQADGKVIISGDFTIVKGLMRRHFARLNADGSGDSSFAERDVNDGVGRILALAMQPDGKALAAHAGGLARFDLDGRRDAFQVKTTDDRLFNQPVVSIAIQPDGKILIGGAFTWVDGARRVGIARLDGNGRLDHGFDPGTGVAGLDGGPANVAAIAVQPDGKILIGGLFAGFDGALRNNFARLEADGSLDHTFFAGLGTDESVQAVAVQNDGKILIGGSFRTVHGISRPRLARLHPDGSLDGGYDPATAPGGGVYGIALLTDGRALIRGQFPEAEGPRRGMMRLHTDGSPDTSFDPDHLVELFAVQADGKLMAVGTAENGFVGLARLEADGRRDPAFHPEGGVYGQVRSGAGQADGKVLIGGYFSYIDGVARSGLARLHGDGSLDLDYVPSSEINPYVHQIKLQPDGKLLVCGHSTTEIFTGTVRGGITRLHADGSRDESFDPGGGADGTVSQITLQGDGRILIGGSFSAVAGTARPGLARLHADGSLDATFDPDPNGIHNSSVLSIVLQPDGRVLVGGYGGGVANGKIRGGLTRFHADGCLDQDFNAGRGGHVRSIALLPDGRMLVGGSFSTADQPDWFESIARLDADGSPDRGFTVPRAFDPGAGVMGITSVTLQPDGKILCNGGYYLGPDAEGNDAYLPGIFRLEADGSLDGSFYAHLTGGVFELRPDGRILVGGGDLIGSNIGRLHGDPAAPLFSIARLDGSVVLSWTAAGGSFQLQESAGLSQADAWLPVAHPHVANGSRMTVTVPITSSQRFFRLFPQ